MEKARGNALTLWAAQAFYIIGYVKLKFIICAPKCLPVTPERTAGMVRNILLQMSISVTPSLSLPGVHSDYCVSRHKFLKWLSRQCV